MKYAISFYWPFFGWPWWLNILNHRWVFVRTMTDDQRDTLGRHLWRLRYLGARYPQIEQGVFPSSVILTREKPVTLEACVPAFPWHRVRTLTNETVTGPHWIEEELPTPYIQTSTGGKPWRSDPNPRSLLIEGSRTNYALWSGGKP